MGLTLYEQETIINMNREDKAMDIYTADPALMRRLSSLPAYTKTGERKQEGKVIAMTFKADKRLLTLRGERPKREYTEEHKGISKNISIEPFYEQYTEKFSSQQKQATPPPAFHLHFERRLP